MCFILLRYELDKGDYMCKKNNFARYCDFTLTQKLMLNNAENSIFTGSSQY